jgi:hypothetical protein
MNKMEVFSDEVFKEKLKSGVTKYVKSAVSNAPSDAQIPLVQIERKIVEVSDYVQGRVIPQIENVFCIKVRALDITSIDVDKSSRGFMELKALTADFEKERMMAQHNAQMSNFNMQNKMQQDQMMAQHNAQLSNFNLQNQMQQNQLKMQSSLNLDAMQRQHEMQLGGQEKMQQMQLDMQQKQMNMQLNNQSETMRIQREEMQRAARLQTEQTFLGAHQANLNAGTVNNALDNGFNAFKQQPVMGGAPAMPGMGGAPQMPGMKAPEPQVSYMLAVNNQQAGPFDWNQLKQLAQQGQLTPQTYVWKQGMPIWDFAGNVPELQPLFASVAPQMPGMPPMPGM